MLASMAGLICKKPDNKLTGRLVQRALQRAADVLEGGDGNDHREDDARDLDAIDLRISECSGHAGLEGGVGLLHGQQANSGGST